MWNPLHNYQNYNHDQLTNTDTTEGSDQDLDRSLIVLMIMITITVVSVMAGLILTKIFNQYCCLEGYVKKNIITSYLISGNN